MINTIIFDLDGTLLNTLEDLTDSVNYALAQLHCPSRTLEEVKSFVGNGVAKLMERAIPDGKENPDYEEALSVFKEHYAIHCNEKTKPYERILEVLDELSDRGYKLAIVSNKFDTAVKELNHIYFGERIQTAIGESEKVRKKPAPDTVYQALAELSVNADNAIYVGDSDVDLATARNVPMPCISVTWGFRSPKQLLEAGAKESLMIDSPYQLLSLFPRLALEE
ncbi:MAG: HAD-IA family hydrolase [Lachnospiraceae bacterium]|nr:HAD-IA family hydrolase [Lachnospiraceae bacterium]